MRPHAVGVGVVDRRRGARPAPGWSRWRRRCCRADDAEALAPRLPRGRRGSQPSPLSGRHADRAVEPDGLAVEHRRSRRCGGRARRTRSGARAATGTGSAPPAPGDATRAACASIGVSKVPGAIVQHADAERRQVARDRQRHADDPALRRRVGRLADLSVERRHRRGVHDARRARPRRWACSSPSAPRRARITLKVPIRLTWTTLLEELAAACGPSLRDGPHGDADAGAVDGDVDRAEALDRARDRRRDGLVAGDVGRREDGRLPQLGRQRRPGRVGPIEDGDAGALLRPAAGRWPRRAPTLRR